MTLHNEYVVVGAGLLGLSTARALARRGREVTVLDQAEIGGEGAGSKGSCRIFRLGYPDPRYVTMVRRVREAWHELEEQSGRRILLPTPHLTFGEQLPAVHEAMLAAGAPCELLSAGQAAERFGCIAAGGPVLLETQSCVIAADQALQALAEEIPDVRTGVRVTAVADDGRQVQVSTDAGALSARTVIVCAGPSTSRLLATAGVAVPATATLEQLAYLAPAAQRRTAGPQPAEPPPGRPQSEMPIFICHGARSPTPYGLPVPGSSLYKIGIHRSGPRVEPGNHGWSPDEEMTRALAQLARRLLPGFSPDPVSIECCIYDNSPDEDFILDRAGNVVIGSGTSGHGFKFGPLLGEWLANLAAGQRDDLPDPRFSLARFPG